MVVFFGALFVEMPIATCRKKEEKVITLGRRHPGGERNVICPKILPKELASWFRPRFMGRLKNLATHDTAER